MSLRRRRLSWRALGRQRSGVVRDRARRERQLRRPRRPQRERVARRRARASATRWRVRPTRRRLGPSVGSRPRRPLGRRRRARAGGLASTCRPVRRRCSGAGARPRPRRCRPRGLSMASAHKEALQAKLAPHWATSEPREAGASTSWTRGHDQVAIPFELSSSSQPAGAGLRAVASRWMRQRNASRRGLLLIVRSRRLGHRSAHARWLQSSSADH